MQLTATTKFSALVNGREIRLDAGEAFKGTEREAQRLIAMGLLDKPKPKRKEVDNER